MHRLFVAIEIPEGVKDGLTALCGGVDGARWRQREQMHLTLRFIGEVDGAVARDIDDTLRGIRAPAFSLTLQGTGFFADRTRARVLWAGVREERPLKQLHDKIERALADIGLEPERRRFRPHVTLARLSDVPRVEAEGYAARHGEYASGEFTVDRFMLFSSYLARDGAIYTPEAEYPLATEEVPV
ncbi:MAG: RNA 2',3'-cyclic phosphodiesterase [Alphaproteobacteria bacterium]|jgi:2'-5' RNA ligase|nr:RNA 2',3'-cyclic phosphodiesterase [Alphaproteobacteria bacterium]